MTHLKYLRYLVLHKWWVLAAGHRMGALSWANRRIARRLIVHDWSKFFPSEWLPYAESFYGAHEWDDRPEDLVDAFDRAWLLHQHRNDHHWQHWILREDDGLTYAMEMPDEAIVEMVADWAGAGRAKTGQWEVAEWYRDQDRKGNIALANRTERCVNILLVHYWGAEE